MKYNHASILKIFLVLILFLQNCSSPKIDKIKGVTFDGPGMPPITEVMVDNVLESNAEWLVTTPEAYTYKNTLEVKAFENIGQWYGESLEGSRKVIEYGKNAGLKILLKPHMGLSWDITGWAFYDQIRDSAFVSNPENRNKLTQYVATLTNQTSGSWRGDFELKDSTKWGLWEKGYEIFILDQARIADSLDIDLLCIGNEIDKVAIARPAFWRQLIKKTREIYSGPVTYAANWNNFENIEFWDELDYISMSAYFPVSEKELPSIAEAKEGWAPHLQKIKALSKKYNKPILFTEFGYKSVKYAGKEPWLEQVNYDPNNEVQTNLYEAIFETFWNESWFKGAILWKWYYAGNGGASSFSPQNKPALEVLKKWFAKE